MDWTTLNEPLIAWTDKAVLAAANAALPDDKDRRLSELLECQQARNLTGTEQSELMTLMQLYQDGLLRKARALCEAVQRGLIRPLAP
jgi:hypothetical protein